MELPDENTVIGTSKINPEGGDYLVLLDDGVEGISIHGQYSTASDAVLGCGNTWGDPTIVKLVKVQIKEIDS